MRSTPQNLEVLYEDNHLIVVNKKAGDIVQGDKTGDTPLSDIVKSYIKDKFNKPGLVFLGVVHRLDRPTTGIVVFARTSKALERMNKMFRDKDVNKTYWAICSKAEIASSGRLVNFLKKNPKNNKSYVQKKQGEGSKEAILNYRTIASGDRYLLMEVDLETGRHHQIRSQLSNLGCVIKGDLKYGAKRSNPDGSISLHSRKIEFTHPVSKEQINITAPLPQDKLWTSLLENS